MRIRTAVTYLLQNAKHDYKAIDYVYDTIIRNKKKRKRVICQNNINNVHLKIARTKCYAIK